MILDNLTRAFKTQNWLAAGVEFVIVITGVVIGFQINAWNEARQEAVIRTTLLTRLADDLSSMHGFFEQIGDASRRNRDDWLVVFRSLERCSIAPEQYSQFQRAFLSYQATPFPQIYRSAYDEMQATGLFSSLPDEMLKTRITRTYAELTQVQLMAGPVRLDASSAGQILWEFADFGFTDGFEITADFDVSAHCEDRRLRNAVWEMIDAHADWARISQRNVASLSELKAAVDQHLGPPTQ